MGLGLSVPARAELEVELDRYQRAHSASCDLVMAWTSASWCYILSTLSVVSGGGELRGLDVVARMSRGSHLLGLSLSGGEVHILSASNVGSCRGGACG
jgi:hypothetical protein